jgi:hypothetical protein
MPYQRYVSKELTHFVGRGKPADEQYRLLLKILRTGELLSDPSRAPGSPWVRWTTINASFSERLMYHFPGVCFCDIPADDFAIHIRKYSPFGIAFSKAFLLSRGASPVFYIANDSHVDPAPSRDLGIRQSLSAAYTRATFFNEMLAAFHDLSQKLLRTATTVGDADDPTARELADIGKRLALLNTYVEEYVFSYCVPFNNTLDDSDERQFYMEREWRVLGDVRFSLADVERVILPRDYGTRLRAEPLHYCGQVTFAM